MPQLDKFTFGPQVVWLVLIFFLLYFILVELALPKLYKILYFRKQKLLSLNQGSVNFVSELFFFSSNINNFFYNFLARIKVFPEAFTKLVEQEVEIFENYNQKVEERILGAYRLPAEVNGIKYVFDSATILKFTFDSSVKI